MQRLKNMLNFIILDEQPLSVIEIVRFHSLAAHLESEMLFDVQRIYIRNCSAIQLFNGV